MIKTFKEGIADSSKAPADYNVNTEFQNNVIGQKIAEARALSGLSLRNLSELLRSYGIKVNPNTIGKWEHGQSVLDCYQLIAVTKALKMEPSLEIYTTTGYKQELNEEGLRRLAAYKDDLIATGRYTPQRTSVEIRYIEMPICDLPVSAGYGAFAEAGNFDKITYPEDAVPYGAEFGLRITGDSMEPVYHDKQIVWVQRCKQLHAGEVGIFIYDGEGYIKVYQEQDPDEEDLEEYTDSNGIVHPQPVMVSFNQKYAPRVISASSTFQIIGRVLS